MDKYLEKIGGKLDYHKECEIEAAAKEPNNKLHNTYIFVYLIIECLEKIEKIDEKLKELFGKSEFKTDKALKTKINGSHPWEKFIEERTTMEQAALDFGKLLKPDLPKKLRNNILVKDIGNFIPSSSVDNNLNEGDRNIVCLGKSFLDIDIDKQIKVCKHLPQSYFDTLKQTLLQQKKQLILF